MNLLAPTLALLALGLLVLPGAAAHANYFTDDGKFRITVGYQGEPVYTYQTTGLDLIIRDNATGGPVEGVHETLNATLIAPGGEELTHPLEPQHGQINRYEFTDGFVLTQPGLYKLRLVGTINGSAVDGEYAMAHATAPRTEIMFPGEGIEDLEDLQARIAAMEEMMANMEHGDHHGATNANAGTGEAPATIFPLLVLGIVAVALLARRR